MGFIGSHTVVELLIKGYEVIIIDNLCNSSSNILKKIEKITFRSILAFYDIDICNEAKLLEVFSTYKEKILGVIHFAGLKSVGESVSNPLLYYANNITGTLTLLQIMKKFQVKNLVFSSSATVYGDRKDDFPEKGLYEEMNITSLPTNPYGKTKLFIEEILNDTAKSDKEWNIAILRYFNPIGAHPSGLIGENPKGIPNNLMPFILQVILKKQLVLQIYGNDYDTPDGTCLRDYIHVVDLAKGHIAAIQYLLEKKPGVSTLNLGSGIGTSVLEIVQCMEKVIGNKIPIMFADRRKGDVTILVACPFKANELLNWKTEKTLTQMCQDSWNFTIKNVNGL